MSLQTKKGTFTLPDSTANLPVTGVGFQPKVVLFWVTKQEADGFAAGKHLCMGWGVSATQRGCLSLVANDAVTVTGENGNDIRDDRCVKAVSISASLISTVFEADFVSMDSDGFTIDPINVTVGENYIVHYLALGGTDITNAFAGVMNTPIATGSLGHTGVGFHPDCVLILANTTGAIPRADLAHKFSIGAASGPSDQAVAVLSHANTIPTQAYSLQKTGEIVHTLNSSGADLVVAALTSLDSDGFTLNYTAVQSTARGLLVLCLKGAQFKVGVETQKTSTGTKAKTGVGFKPGALLLFGTNRASSASVDSTLSSLSVGASDGATEGATWVGSADAVSTTDENSATISTKIIRHATGPSTTNAEADLNSFDSDGFTLNWSTADGTAREFVYLAVGGLASQIGTPVADSVVGTYVNEVGGTTNLYQSIDEAVASDADYVESVLNPATVTYRFKISNLTTPGGGTRTARWRLGKNSVGGAQVNAVCKIYEGGGNVAGAGTLVNSFTHNDVPSTPTTYEDTVTGSVTDYTNLYGEVVFTQV